MKRKVIILTLLAVALFASPMAVNATGVGSLRITPHGSYYPLPVMLKSPATFNITATDHSTGYDPIILLVMTDECYKGLTGEVTVQYSGGWRNFTKSDFKSISLNSAYIPTTGVENGAKYHVSSLKDHLGVTGADTKIWYAYGEFLSKPVTQKPQWFTITLSSTNTRMLVYALAKSHADVSLRYHSFCVCENKYDMRVPPTQPGFVVPDAAPLLMALASFGALGLFLVKRKKA
jgi:hypothetical protein